MDARLSGLALRMFAVLHSEWYRADVMGRERITRAALTVADPLASAEEVAEAIDRLVLAFEGKV